MKRIIVMNEDPYKTLGVSPDATPDEIKQAYRTLVKRYHPDLNPNDEVAARKMSEINAAYEAIKSGNVQKSSNTPAGSFNRDGQTYHYAYMDPDDIIEAIFGSLGKFAQGGYSGHIDPDYDVYGTLERYIDRGSYRQAARILDSIDKRDGMWYYCAGRVCFETGNLSDAVKYAQCAVSMEPNNLKFTQLLEGIKNAQNGMGRRKTFGHVAVSLFCGFLVLMMIINFLGGIFPFFFI